MKFGVWHQRRGGEWMVKQCVRRTGVEETAVSYEWVAQINDGCLPTRRNYAEGCVPWAWLARLQAIAALKRMGGAE